MADLLSRSELLDNLPELQEEESLLSECKPSVYGFGKNFI